MKKLTILIAMLIAIGGCSNEVPYDQLVQRGGLNYEVNSQTPFTGSIVGYHENGQLEVKGNYKDGLEDGLSENYYENGQLKLTGNYKDGKEIPLN
jgi:antitoxin component YwqK of YwqJK toxin-antitoxin module